jgi:hypothetical protein
MTHMTQSFAEELAGADPSFDRMRFIQDERSFMTGYPRKSG